ncbi:Wzy polymerase domain-containing protein [Neisseria lisongii]|uniref:Wzy polymerase domain-containing protein n=1 Tax=Neisseria lisongii TaxID=2912188 RepID=A0AAW5AMQ7_9NEIS|nr:Wzy polymerase domain-containing protein [Neisseria lisongii]MCF7529731.1 Wzy polymerase domain-containing protein [Neisseria lisongii]
MFSRFSDGLSECSSRDLLPLYLCFGWIAVAPFLSLYRVGPLSSFYLETASLLGAVCLLLLSAAKGLLNVRLPQTAVGLVILAAYWWLQARLMNLTYPGMSDIVVWGFIILAAAQWSLRGWVKRYGQTEIAAALAWALLIGALLQATVAFMQFKGWANADWLKGIIAYSGRDNINGQLGQRNHLGHYLMWGLLACAYLWSEKRLNPWSGCLLMFALAAVLGLVNSRTILGYLIAVGMLLPLWRIWLGKATNRSVIIFALALFAAALCQYAAGPLLEWLSDTPYETALERAANSSFEGSARQTEWLKAWLAFKNAPLFGHGWNGYAAAGFELHAQTQQFSNNILNVLFTHSHNLVLQLLAEMGLTGTLLVGATLLAGAFALLRRPCGNASFFALALIAVSLCHSMLEYPLWYFYFLTPFALFFALAPVRTAETLPPNLLRRAAAAVFALCLLGGIARTTYDYYQLTGYARISKQSSPQQNQAQIEGLRRIAAENAMLRYYAELALSRRADPSDAFLPDWAAATAIRSLSYRPYATAYQVGLYQYRQGDTVQGQEWLAKIYRYYPYMMPFYTGKIDRLPVYRPLLSEILNACQTFINQPKHPTAKPCKTGN